MWLSESEMGPGDVELILHHVTREEWRATSSKGRHRVRHPFKLVLDHYTYTEPCYSYQQCMREVKEMQRLHMEEGFSDIKYHFLIGGDGNIYEGRGWGMCSSRALRSVIKLWRRRLDIAFIGDFTERKLPDIMQTRYDHIITYGVHFNMIRRFCNTFHVRNNIEDFIPLECEVRKTTRKKPPRSERPRKRKKKKRKELSDLSFHSNTDLNTNATDSRDTSERDELPFTSSYYDTGGSYYDSSSDTSDTSKSSHKSNSGKTNHKDISYSSETTYDSDTEKSSNASKKLNVSDKKARAKYDPKEELKKIVEKAVTVNERSKEPM